MSNVMSSSTIMITGGMMSNIVAKQSSKKINYAQFMLSANGMTVWATVFDEDLFDFINRNARKGTQMEITSKIQSLTVTDEQSVMNVVVRDVRFINNFGAEYVRKQEEKITPTPQHMAA